MVNRSVRVRPVLALCAVVLIVAAIPVWRDERQRALNHSLVEAVQSRRPPSEIENLLALGADPNTTTAEDEPWWKRTWNRLRGRKQADSIKVPVLLVAAGANVSPSLGLYSTPPADQRVILSLLKHGARFRQPVSPDGWKPSKGWGIWAGELTLVFSGPGHGMTIPFGNRASPDPILVDALQRSDLPRLKTAFGP